MLDTKPLFGNHGPLDALLLEALDQEARRKFKKIPTLKPEREAQIKETFKNLYLSPDNWLPRKIVAVVHRSDSGEYTLLGAFQKMIHVTNRHLPNGKTISRPTGASKLVRCEGPVSVEEEMIVNGDYWLHGIQPLSIPDFGDNPEGIADHQLAFDLHLGDLGVEASKVQIEVRTERGWIRRVVLRDTTQFFCPTNKIVIFLPKGTEILEAMSFECKKKLKEKVSK